MAKGERPGALGRLKIGWEFFGSELKRQRESAGLTQHQLGERVFCSGSYIGQFEAGFRKPQLDLAERIDVELRTGGLLGRMCAALINSSPYANYFAEAVYLESLAVSIRQYAPVFVPGILQTRAYARAVFLAAQPLAPEEKIEELVVTRLERGKLLNHPTTPLLWVVLDESVLRREVGGPAVMHEQLTYIAQLMRRRRILVQVLPLDTGAPPIGALLKLMTFEDMPPVAYEEGSKTGNLLDDPAVVDQCELAYDLARAAALSPERSLALIESAAEEYGHEQ
ncbi:helix-turn-helix transcriptional regulator [Streptomyces sp. NPDC093109]|uniref:helix-turn-helix domain-containing protein n=1 Tax=Streptomyces sp. NPDC093109 TaxID=3154977 RepID=UPI00344DBAC0